VEAPVKAELKHIPDSTVTNPFLGGDYIESFRFI
jgi:hypothetical protein